MQQEKAKSKYTEKEIFETLPVATSLRIMILPSIISQLIVLIYNMADTFFVGQVGNPYMVAGTSLILPVFNISLCLSGLAGVGGGALISRLMGHQRHDEARRVSVFSLYLGVALAAMFSIIIGVFMRPLLTTLGATDNTYEYAAQYASCVIVAGGIPTVLSNVMATLIRNVGHSRQASTGIILGGLLNIALDPLFMFVILPSGNEVFGAGLATALSNCVACMYFIIVIIRMGKDRIVTFNPKVGLASKRSIAEVFYVGVPSSISTLLFDLDYVIIDKLMASYHDVALAAVGIVLKIERFPLNVGVGICQGTLPLLAYSYAANDHKRINDTIKKAWSLGLIIAAISIVLYEIFAVQLSAVFIADAQTAELAAGFLRIRVLATPLMFTSFFLQTLFQAYGMGKHALILGVVRWLGLNIPMLFILNSLVGMYGIVWTQVTADAINVVISFILYRKCSPVRLKQKQ